MIEANNPNLTTWIEVPTNSDFPIQNIPFGVAEYKGVNYPSTRIGNTVVLLSKLEEAGLFSACNLQPNTFNQSTLNQFVQQGKAVTRAVRNTLSSIFSGGSNSITAELKSAALVNISEVTMVLPIQIGDYTDFYSSREHATNVGTMFRDPNNALLPNWLHLPVGYHGRASSIIPSGVAIHRPKGQTKPNPDQPPVYGSTQRLDFELEVGFFTHQGKPLGDCITTAEAEEYIFGLVLFNDWSARDMQTWEYVPLGPFLAKNFASSVSPWIVTLDALEPYRVPSPDQSEVPVLPYLEFEGNKSYDLNLEVYIETPNGDENKICGSNFKYMYWNMVQQLAHHTVNGCNINAGDLLASGTISGPTEDSYGSMLELAWKGTKPLKMKDGSERKFIHDGDAVIMRGHCSNGSTRIGFGEVYTKVLPTK